MFIDALQLFSDSQALTGTSAVVSTNVVPLGPGAERRIGTGEPMAVLVVFEVGLAGSATETITITVQSDAADSFGSPATVAVTGALSEAQAATGKQIAIALPPGVSTEAYLRLSYLMAGTTPTATVTAFLTPLSMIADTALIYYPDAITIS